MRRIPSPSLIPLKQNHHSRLIGGVPEGEVIGGHTTYLYNNDVWDDGAVWGNSAIWIDGDRPA